MSIVINIILILASIVLIIAVLMQEGNKQGLGAIGGAAETFMGKSKAKSAEGKLLLITKIVAAVFVVLAILATWLNARTYTITFYNEDGSVYTSDSAGAGTQLTLSSVTVPAKTGYDGKWVLAEKKDDGTVVKKSGELPTELGRKDIAILAEYTVQQHSVTIVDNFSDEEGNTPEEGQQLFTVTADYGTDIDYGDYTMPEKDGEYVFYATSKTAVKDDAVRPATLPTTIPETDVTYYVSNVKGSFVELYVKPEAEEETAEETATEETAAEETPAEETAADETENADTENADTENAETAETETAAEETAQGSEFVEYFPMLMEDAELQAYMYYNYYQQTFDAHELYDTALETLAGKTEEEKDFYRLFVKEGADLNEALASVIVHTHDGTSIAWTTEDGQDLSGVMGTERIKLYASYYTPVSVTFAEEAETEDENYELTNVTISGKAGSAISESRYPVKEGFKVEWIDDEIKVFPEEAMTVKFRFVADETATEEETAQDGEGTAEDTTEGADTETEETADDAATDDAGTDETAPETAE